jgi:hypothetical protein
VPVGEGELWELYSCADEVACWTGETPVTISRLVDEGLGRHNEEVHVDFLGVGVLDLDRCNVRGNRIVERVVSDLSKWL